MIRTRMTTPRPVPIHISLSERDNIMCYSRPCLSHRNIRPQAKSCLLKDDAVVSLASFEFDWGKSFTGFFVLPGKKHTNKKRRQSFIQFLDIVFTVLMSHFFPETTLVTVVKYLWQFAKKEMFYPISNGEYQHCAMQNQLTLFDCEDNFCVRIKTHSVYSTPVRPWVVLCQMRDGHIECVPFVADAVFLTWISLLFFATY